MGWLLYSAAWTRAAVVPSGAATGSFTGSPERTVLTMF